MEGIRFFQADSSIMSSSFAEKNDCVDALSTTGAIHTINYSAPLELEFVHIQYDSRWFISLKHIYNNEVQLDSNTDLAGEQGS